MIDNIEKLLGADEIEYRGKKYWAKIIDMKDYIGVVTVSTTELSEKLVEDMQSEDKKIARIANITDDCLYYFLDEQEQQMTEMEMVRYIKGNS